MSNPAKRPKNIQVRLTSEEHNAFNRAAARAGKAPSTWLRDLGLDAVLSFNKLPEYSSGGMDQNPPLEVKASDVPGRSENGAVEFIGVPPHPPMPSTNGLKSAQDRIYEIILRRDGKAKADAWLSQRRKPVAPVIVEPTVPENLRVFYNSIEKDQGKAAADFWLLNNAGGKKINI